jgi:hypothetical protein
LLKFAFFSWLPNLPETDFGKTISSYATSYDNATGFDKMITTVFGTDKTFTFHVESVKESWPHPAELLQFLIPRGYFRLNAYYNMTREVTKSVEYQSKIKFY